MKPFTYLGIITLIFALVILGICLNVKLHADHGVGTQVTKYYNKVFFIIKDNKTVGRFSGNFTVTKELYDGWTTVDFIVVNSLGTQNICWIFGEGLKFEIK